jgi:2,5-diamino-6-(ribosylamino)-4(3H)-pyrimidinone 5'-phosphate reductase
VKPHIILNCAASADGKIALPNRQKLDLSNSEDFSRVHQLRSECDAILVGIGTVIEDNPSLTINHKYSSGNDPLRIILDTNYRIPEDSKILSEDKNTVIAIGEHTDDRDLPNVEIFRCGKDEINLQKLITYLGEKGIEKILVEGGETVMWSFLEKELFDELNIFISNIIVGGKETPTIAGGKGYANAKNTLKLKLKNIEKLGDGILIKYSKRKN